jgi:ribonuclease HI
MIEVWTDGATRPTNPGPGGAAWLIKRSGKVEVGSCGYAWTTNNRMELKAVVEVLCLLRRGSRVRLYSDSAYVVNAFNKGWLRKWMHSRFQRPDGTKIKNSDLWRDVSLAAEGLTIEWVHIRGHMGLPENERVDEMAGEAAQHATLPDVFYLREHDELWRVGKEGE